MTDITLEQRARELLAAEVGSPLPLEISIVAAAAAVEAALRLSAVADWQPIETAPRTGKQERMLLAWADGTVEQGMWLNNEKWQGFRPESLRPWPDGQPTHWQPLPAAPRHETGEG